MVTATALKLTVTTGQFRPKYHGHFPPEQVVTLFRNQVVNISETSIRQTDYYLNAAKYLGLVEKRRDLETGLIGGFLTEKGQRVFQLGLIERQKEFIKLILEHRAFQLTLESHLKKGEMPTIDEIVEFMKESNLYNVASNSTYYRRASTIIGWINWIVAQIEE